MKNVIITIVLGIFFISLTSAIYGGECEQLDLSDLESLDNVVYIPIGNSSNLEGLNIYLNGTNVNICPALNYKLDNFTLVFWDNTPEIKEVVKEVVIYRGGGGTRTKYIYENVTEYIEVEKIIYINKTDEVIEIEKEPEIIEDKKSKGWIIWLIIIGFVILIIVFLLLRGKK